MKSIAFVLVAVATFVSQVVSCYTFPSLIVNGRASAPWEYTRQTNNYNTQAPVTDVRSREFRCYTTQTNPNARTARVRAGTKIGIKANGPMYHKGVVNVYMARAPLLDIAIWDGAGPVWFKVHEISAITDGGDSITFPAEGLTEFDFMLPKSLPNGDYLVRTEQIALENASAFQGAKFYISCSQIQVIGGGKGNPGPLIRIPGVYSGFEPGIRINIHHPIPKNYTQPGPAVWKG